jgi:hypothetical protein
MMRVMVVRFRERKAMPGDSRIKSKRLIHPWVPHSRWLTSVVTVAVVGGVVYCLNPIAIKDRTAAARPTPLAKTWSRFTWPEIGVEVIMPEGPQMQRLRTSPADPTRQRVAYASTADATTYFLSSIDYSRDVSLPETDEELMANASQWLGAGAVGHDATVERISHSGHNGLEANHVSQASDGRRVRNRARWFLKGRRGIIAGVTGNVDQFDETGATRFLESLQFSEKKK